MGVTVRISNMCDSWATIFKTLFWFCCKFSLYVTDIKMMIGFWKKGSRGLCEDKELYSVLMTDSEWQTTQKTTIKLWPNKRIIAWKNIREHTINFTNRTNWSYLCTNDIFMTFWVQIIQYSSYTKLSNMIGLCVRIYVFGKMLCKEVSDALSHYYLMICFCPYIQWQFNVTAGSPL